MSYLIISIYDSGYEMSVCDNGKIINKFDKYGNFNKKFDYYWGMYCLNNFRELISLLSYDLIILCEDGFIEILKGKKR